ncbi:MAG: hypothetical protein K1X81_07740 [Bacteroidia bacterium]|nr:hypothetical protein [Bacteroidia bacterium]
MIYYLTKIRAFGFIFFFFVVVSSYGQHKFVRYNVDDGLSQSSVYSIFQDSKGFMWFGTGDGLNRFDGYRFESFKTGQRTKPGLSNSFITAKALEDKNGNLWFGTRSGGLNKFVYARQQFEHVPLYNSKGRNDFDCELIGFDSKNNLWFLNGSNTLGCYDEVTKKSFFIEMPEGIRYSGDGGPNRMGLLINDTIFFIGNWKLVVFPVAQKQFIKLLEKEIKATGSTFTISLCFDKKNETMWIGTEKGVMQYQLTAKTHHWIDLTKNHTAPIAYTLVKDNYNRLWIGTAKSGLLCYHLKTQTLTTFQNDPNDPKSLSFDIIRYLFIDRSENLWIGTDGGGINKTDLKPPKLNVYAEHTFIKCFYEDRQKNIWAGTHENGILIIDRKKNQTQQLKRKEVFGNIVSCITTDVYGNLIIGSDNGIDYYHNGKYEEVPSNPKADRVESNNLVYDICHTDEKTTLVATRLGLFEAKYKNRKMDTLQLNKNLHTLILRVHQSRDKRIWVSTAGNSYLFILKYRNGNLEITDRILWQTNVRCFYEDTLSGILWMASEKGLIRYNLQQNSYTLITTDDGLADNYLYAVLPDEKGQLWMSSNKGLICYNPATKSCHNYNVTDGLQSNEFNTGAFYKSVSGELFFGGINGFNAFFPVTLKDNPYTPLAVLTSLKINDGTVSGEMAGSSHITLPFDSSTLTFEFAGLEFTNQSKNEYRYLLEGWDKVWVLAGKARLARYSNLPPGKYTFKVQVSNNDEVWGPQTALIRIHITPPYWKQWWFVLLTTAAGLTFLILFIRQFIARRLREKLRELEKQQAVQKERERISKDMHDDLGSGLSRIAIQSELLKHKLKRNENAELQAEKIVLASRELVDNLSEIVWALNPRHDSMQSLMAYLREFTTDLFEENEIRCVFLFPEPMPNLTVPSEVRRNIYLILKEALNNSYKYAAATQVTLEMKVNGTQVIFTAADNGKGFDMNNTRQFGNGVANMQRRAKNIKAGLTIQSQPDKGTQLEIRVII